MGRGRGRGIEDGRRKGKEQGGGLMVVRLRFWDECARFGNGGSEKADREFPGLLG